jgi:hypothetical protein
MEAIVPLSEPNHFVPEWSNGPVIAFDIAHPISVDGFREKFLPVLEEKINEYGEVRILLHFTEYQGWEEAAARLDLDTTARFGRYVTKLAVVNPTRTVILLYKVKEPLLNGEARFFSHGDLAEALKWINEKLPG